MNTFRYRCCFCDKIIDSTAVDPCDLNIMINVDKGKEKQDNQTFYCHINCFQKKLSDDMKKRLIVHIIDDEE